MLIVQLAKGWRALSDDAIISFRSYDVLTRHSPLVGQFTQASHISSRATYDPGPLLYWGLAIPTRLDHQHGALIGAALLSVVFVGLAIEAAYAVAGSVASAVVSVAVLAMLLDHSRFVIDPIWNPHLGQLAFIASILLAWATACRSWRWLPALVVTASFAAQAHLLFTAGALAGAIAAPLIALARERKRPPWRPVILAAIAGIVCWLPPVIQQLTTDPGNFTLLHHTRGSGRVEGMRFGLTMLTSAIGPRPSWTVSIHGQSLFRTLAVIKHGHPPIVAAVVIVLLAVIAAVAFRVGEHRLAALASIAALVSVAVVVTYAALPGDQVVLLTYLYVGAWPVGMLDVATIGWAAVVLVRWQVAKQPHAAMSRTAGPWVERHRLAVAVVVACAMTVPVTATLVHDATGSNGTTGGWAGVAALHSATGTIERSVPRGAVYLVSGEAPTYSDYAVIFGLVWKLRADGWEPLVDAPAALNVSSAVNGETHRARYEAAIVFNPGHPVVVRVAPVDHLVPGTTLFPHSQ